MGGQPGTPYAPPPLRDDPALGAELNRRIVAWCAEQDLYAGRLDLVEAGDFGRLVMLAHPDTDDVDRLMLAARPMVAEFAVDDAFCDQAATSGHPEALGSQLMLSQAAIDPPALPAEYQGPYERARHAEPVHRALAESITHLETAASPAQVARLRAEMALLFLGMDAEAGWRVAGTMPSVWEYLVNRQGNSFLPCLVLVDVVGGYELAPHVYSHPEVRRAVLYAAMASVLCNDIYSAAKEAATPGVHYNLPTVIEHEEGCTPQEAHRKALAIHDECAHAFEQHAAALAAWPDPTLHRFLAGLWAWLGGSKHWHETSARYNRH